MCNLHDLLNLSLAFLAPCHLSIHASASSSSFFTCNIHFYIIFDVFSTHPLSQTNKKWHPWHPLNHPPCSMLLRSLQHSPAWHPLHPSASSLIFFKSSFYLLVSLRASLSFLLPFLLTLDAFQMHHLRQRELHTSPVLLHSFAFVCIILDLLAHS